MTAISFWEKEWKLSIWCNISMHTFNDIHFIDFVTIATTSKSKKWFMIYCYFVFNIIQFILWIRMTYLTKALNVYNSIWRNVFYDIYFYMQCATRKNKKILNEYNKNINQMATFVSHLNSLNWWRVHKSNWLKLCTTNCKTSSFSISPTLHLISHMETFSNSKQGNLAPTGKIFAG